MVRQVDIARAAGTSIPTVCRVLAGKGREYGVAPEMSRRIRETAARLGYQVNQTARALRTKRHEAVGVLFHSTEEPLYGELVPAIQSRLHDRGYAAICGFWTNTGAESSIRAVVGHGVDGLITCQEPGQIPADILAGLPAVFFAAEDAAHDTVNVNGEESLVQAAAYLVSKGHRRLGLLDIPASYADTILARLRPVDVTLHGFVLDYQLLDTPGSGGLAAIAARLVGMPRETRPTGLLCRNDLVAVRLLSLLAEAGCRVPGDFSVVGFDDTRLARWASPTLTSFGAPVAKLADALVETLFERLAHPCRPPIHIVVPRVLNARRSTSTLGDRT